MNDTPEDFDWVTDSAERAAQKMECTAQKMFERLRERVKSDVADADGKSRHAVKFQELTEYDFLVQRKNPHGDRAEHDQMVFSLVRERIMVRDGTGDDFLKAHVTATGTDCLLDVSGHDRPFRIWEFSRRALEPVFFGD